MSENDSTDDGDSMTEVVVEEATNQLDAEGLVDGDSLGDQLESAEVGRAVGARLGETAGRRIGAAIGRRVHEVLADVDAETRPRQLGSDLVSAVRDGISDALAESRERGSALAAIADAFQESNARSLLASAIGDGDRTADEEADGETSAETDDAASPEESTPEPSLDGLDVDELDTDDLESFQEETLAEYLETISYRDLQSIAKELGVTANITHEEMTDRIVETVTDDQEA